MRVSHSYAAAPKAIVMGDISKSQMAHEIVRKPKRLSDAISGIMVRNRGDFEVKKYNIIIAKRSMLYGAATVYSRAI